MEQKKLDRISELTRISRTRALTAEETAERTALREEYRASMLAGLEGHLQNTYLKRPDGTLEKLKKHS